ncbi:MAG: aminotransferase class V-fold PLP-dependent enzyme, partial [Allorhizobium sp.]
MTEPRLSFATASAVKAPIYLDHHATTPVDIRVAEIVFNMMVSTFGNANSIDHTFGEAAATIVENAKSNVAELVGSDPANVFFTSGSTEAIRLAISHAIGPARASPLHIALTRVEHQALIDTVRLAERLGIAVVTWIDVSRPGTAEQIPAILPMAVAGLCPRTSAGPSPMVLTDKVQRRARAGAASPHVRRPMARNSRAGRNGA